MSKKTPAFQAALLTAALLLHAPGHAELYKWIDANGKIHYSDRKDGAGKAQVDALQHEPAPVPGPQAAGPTWQERERDYKLRQARASHEAPQQAGGVSKPVHSYYRNEVETDKSRCELARDIVSGRARLFNGAVTDANDRQIAQRDISPFCH